jgi:hypothetical protein
MLCRTTARARFDVLLRYTLRIAAKTRLTLLHVPLRCARTDPISGGSEMDRDTPDSLRRQAEQCRALAPGAALGSVRLALLEMADSYEEKARRLEEIERHRT